jgi:hypothetical protein
MIRSTITLRRPAEWPLARCGRRPQHQKLELYEQQNYAPGGLKIVRIAGKLYFVRMRDLEQ